MTRWKSGFNSPALPGRVFPSKKALLDRLAQPRAFVVPLGDRAKLILAMRGAGWTVSLDEDIPNDAFAWIEFVPSKGAKVAAYDYRPQGFTAEEIAPEIRYKNIDTGDPDLDMSSGLATPSVTPEKQEHLKEHPLHRPVAFGEGSPSFIRFMWDPMTGDMLLTGDESFDHAGMHVNYKGRDKKANPYDAWIRGYYKPSTGETFLRPWDWPAKGKEYDPIAERVTGSLGERIKSRLLWLLSKEMGVPFEELKKNTRYYVNEQELQEELGKRRRY